MVHSRLKEEKKKFCVCVCRSVLLLPVGPTRDNFIVQLLRTYLYKYKRCVVPKTLQCYVFSNTPTNLEKILP